MMRTAMNCLVLRFPNIEKFTNDAFFYPVLDAFYDFFAKRGAGFS